MKLNRVKPKGMLCWHTYAADRGGCAAIRVWFPSLLLSQEKYKDMTFNPTWNNQFVRDPSFYKNLNWVKFQRPGTEGHLKMIQYFIQNIGRETGTHIFIELDDYLLDIPDTNMASSYYREKRDIIIEMLSIVDGITVSTEFLRNKLLKYNKNISVIKNYLNKFHWGEPLDHPEEVGEKIRILYPGSQNHFNRDGFGGDFSTGLIDFIKGTRDIYQWNFLGAIPNELKGIQGIYHYQWETYFKYPYRLKEIRPHICIAPLEINNFNRAKSDIKLLEYTNIGACGIYQDIEPYRKATLKCLTSEEMISLIQRAGSDEYFRKNALEKDRKKLEGKMFLEDNIKEYIDGHLKLLNRKLG